MNHIILLLKKRYALRIITVLLFINAYNYAIASYWTDRGNYDISWYNSTLNEFCISNAKQLSGVAYLVNNGYANFYNKKITLNNDIDLSSNTWKCIGTSSSLCFKGIFDGQGHTIKNIEIELGSGTYPYFGFFGQLYNADIQNLTLDGTIWIHYDSSAYPNATIGSFAAYSNNCNFQNCISNFYIYYQRETTNSFEYDIYIGGMVGQTYYSVFDNCIHDGNFNFKFGRDGFNSEYYDSSTEIFIGGIAGESQASTFKYCGNICNIFKLIGAGSQNSSYLYATIAGIVAELNSSTLITSCFNNMENVQLASRGNSCGMTFGGIAGSAKYYSVDKGGIYNCYNSTNKLNVSFPTSSTFTYGGICCRYNNSNPNKYIANYSAKDFTIYSMTNIDTNEGYSGSMSFTKEEMMSDDFLSDLNIYPQINGEGEIWIRDSKFPYIKINNSSTNISDIIINDTQHSYNNDAYYDLRGNLVEKPTKGIYIHNGKKIFIK